MQQLTQSDCWIVTGALLINLYNNDAIGWTNSTQHGGRRIEVHDKLLHELENMKIEKLMMLNFVFHIIIPPEASEIQKQALFHAL